MSQTKEEFMELNEVLNKMYYREGLSVIHFKIGRAHV